ncbi:MAG: TetR/AcrR family transcriptional regulator C-terminal domain-containing protein [Actinomycetota bacterium]|nr:TetR/AcrR family transcriptional regulator C-terminal domain-containing protein [Actinomycetota bacterium]
MTPEPASQPRIPLTRERVLEAAVHLADEGGIESLTMRKLAGALGVEAMSLYNHVANKDDLVAAMVDLVVSEIELPSAGKDWDVDIRTCAVSAHEALLRHPWACSLVLSPGTIRTLPKPRLLYMEWLLRRLREAGFSPDLTYHAYHALDSHIFGFTLWQLGHSIDAIDLTGSKDFADLVDRFLRELPAADYPYLAEHARQHATAPSGDGAREFQFGLELILEGLEKARETA